MPTFSGGGLTREVGEFFNVQLLDATSLDDAGFVLAYQVEASVTKVDLCSSTEVPACVNYRSTRDPHDMNFPTTLFLKGSDLGEAGLPVLREGWAKLKVATNNSVGKRGDTLECTGSGKVDIHTPTVIDNTSAATVTTTVEARFDELARIVGTIEEEDLPVGNATAPGQDKVLTHLTIRKNGIIT